MLALWMLAAGVPVTCGQTPQWHARTGLQDSSSHLPWRAPGAQSGKVSPESEANDPHHAARDQLERALAQQAQQRDQTLPRLLRSGASKIVNPLAVPPLPHSGAPQAQRLAAERSTTVPTIRAAAHQAPTEATTEGTADEPPQAGQVVPAAQQEDLPSILAAPHGPTMRRIAPNLRRELPEDLPAPLPVLQQPASPPPDTASPESPSDRPGELDIPNLQFSQPSNDTGPDTQTAIEYNGRDCAADQRDCEDTIQSLADRPMEILTIDITPELSVNPLDPEEEQQRQIELLRRIPSRVWRNMAGETLAEGYLRDYRDGQVSIVDGQGQLVARIPIRDLGEDERCFVSAWWGLPTDCRLPSLRSPERNWAMTTFTWTSPALHHKPLYFEEAQLERYGHTTGPLIQPFVSMAHFFGRAATLPYHVGMHPPNECRYELGYYRPGDCAPWLVSPIPLHAHGARLQVAALVGLAALIP